MRKRPSTSASIGTLAPQTPCVSVSPRRSLTRVSHTAGPWSAACSSPISRAPSSSLRLGVERACILLLMPQHQVIGLVLFVVGIVDTAIGLWIVAPRVADEGERKIL